MTLIVNDFPLDVVLNGKWTRKVEVSQYPMEKGFNLTDHLRVNQPDLQFDGIVSDTPIGAVALHPSRSEQTRPTNLSFDSSISAAAFKRLDALAGQIVTVECSLGVFTQMVMTNLDISRDVKTRKGFKVTIAFNQVRIEENVRTSVAVSGGFNDFGLSLSNPVKGNHVLWRKGRPPGGPQIVGQEVIEVRDNANTGRSSFFHLNGKPLTTSTSSGTFGLSGPKFLVGGPKAPTTDPPEQEAFFADFSRDQQLRRDQQNRDAITKVVDRKIKEDKWIRGITSSGGRSQPRGTIQPSLFGK